jgi:hypothetical protein
MNRYTLLTVLSVLTLFCPTSSEAQVTSNVLERVLNVRVNAGTPQAVTATAFTVDVDGREYLITAKHVVQGLKQKDKIDIFVNDKWSPLHVQIFRCDDPVDIAVLIPPYQLTVNFDFSYAESDMFFVGQEAYFLGFPFDFRIPSKGANGPYPLAMIKQGLISAVVPQDSTNRVKKVYLDGYNNPGFSGGPIVYRDLNQTKFVLNLLGVISGFVPEFTSTMDMHPIESPSKAGNAAKAEPWRIGQKADGTYYELVDNGSYVTLNTGIVVGYLIKPAIDLIGEHPIGPEVKDLPGNKPIVP